MHGVEQGKGGDEFKALPIAIVRNASPSLEDISVTKRPKEAGELMGIDLLDHFIIEYDEFIPLKGKDYLCQLTILKELDLFL